MKRIMFLFWSFVNLTGAVIADAKLDSKESVIKPIKVSEINANLFSVIYDFFKEAKITFFEGIVSLKDFVETGEWFLAELQDPEMRDLISSFGVRLGISLVLAFLMAQLVSRWLKARIHSLLLNQDYYVAQRSTAFRETASFPAEAPILSGVLAARRHNKVICAALLSTIAPLLFGFLLYTLFRIMNPSDGIYLETVRIISSGAVTIWILLNVAHIFLRPLNSEYQHIPFSPEGLNSLYIWIRRIAYVALFGFFALETGRLIDLPHAGERLLLQTSSFAIITMAICMVISLHKNLKPWIQKQRENPKRSRLKRSLLPYLEYSTVPLIIFIGMSYISWVSHEYDRFQLIVWKILLTLALLPILRYIAYCLKKLRILYIHKNFKRFSVGFSERAIFYGRQIDFVLIFLLYAFSCVFVLDLWGLDPYYFIYSNTGRLIAEKVFSVFVILMVALFLTRAGMKLLNTYLSAEQDVQSETHKQKMARFKTIHSVSRNVLRIAVWTPAFLLIIMEMDIEIIPILAPVTVLTAGLAFGMQSLVKDFVTGFFMLLEDAFAVGDLVVINGQMGRIDSVTVRVVRLRATDGSVYTFPYGNITSLCNQNRDFSAAVMLFEVGIDADVNQVIEILEKISKDLRKDPKTRGWVVEPIQIDGVNEINDHALQIRAIIKTKPGQHYKVKYAFNLLLKQYLGSYGVPSATPRQVAYSYVVEK